ncbi:PTS sugar transporter subunit IIA [Thermodesulfobacteriota bacterium]
MKILDVLQKDAILVDLKALDKKGVLEELVMPVADIAGVNHEDLVRVLMERERLGSTGIGGGVGIPHGKLKDLESMVIGFGLSRKGVDFESMDGQPVHIFFLLITPENSTGLHLKLLARISRILKNDSFKEKLLNAGDRDEIFSIIQEEDETFNTRSFHDHS